MMTTRRSLFVFGALLAVGVLLAPQAVFAQAVPAAGPGSVTAVASGFDSVLVNWTAPSTSPADWTGFDVGYAPHATQNDFAIISPQLIPVGADARRATLTALMSNTRYVVGVRATNATGDGSWVIASALPTTDMLPAVPQVTGLALEPGDGMITATWNAVTDRLGVTGYEVMVTAANGFSQTLPVGNVTQYIIRGLANDTEYTVTVTAVANNEAGATGSRRGAPSASETATPMAATTDPGNGNGNGNGNGDDPWAGVTVTVGTVTHNSIMVSWDAVDGATQYNVGWSEHGSSVNFNTDVRSGTSHTITDLMPETTYDIWVCAQPNLGCNPDPIPDVTTMAAPPPNAPAGRPVVTLTEEEESLVVSWLAVDTATKYMVEWRTSLQTFGDPMRQMEVMGAMTHTIMSLTGGMEYMVRVSAGNEGGYGPTSAEVMGTPKAKPVVEQPTEAPTSAPAGVEAMAGVESVTVSWTALTGATKYKVEWRTAAQLFGVAARQAEVMTGTSHTIPGLTAGTEYMVQVMAGNEGGYGPASAEVKATPTAKPVVEQPTEAPTSAPAGVEAMAGEESVMVSWTALAGATKYKVEWRTAAQTFGAAARQAEVMTGTSHTITGLTGDMEYMIQVMAGNEGGYGPASAEVKATPTAKMVDPTRGAEPTNVKLTPEGRNKIKVSWDYSGEGTDTAIRFDVGWTEAAGAMFTDSLAPQTIVPVPGRREARSYVLENLAINDEYLIAVRAVHGDGAGGQITPVPADWAYRVTDGSRERTPADVYQVQNVNVAAGDGMLTVTWDEVSSVGTCTGAASPAVDHCGYLIDWRAANQSFDNPDRQMRVTDLTADIMGLMNGTEYGVIVRAYNEREGKGTLSTASAEARQTPMMPTPALPVFGVLALGAGLLAAGRRRLRAQRQRLLKS